MKMFEFSVYMDRNITDAETAKIRNLVSSTCTKLNLPFGSHCISVCGTGGQDTFPIFCALSNAGLNVTCESNGSGLAVMSRGAEVSVKLKQILWL